MAAFSTNTTNILPHFTPPYHHHLRRCILLRYPISTSTSAKTHLHRKFQTKAPPISTALPQSAIVTEENSNSSSASTSTSISNEEWTVFAEKVSGEWDGFGADFTADGKAIELPESVVPEAYREWEVKVFDWQTQCPTLAQLIGESSPSLIYKTIKLLPTVGCEADAATRHTVEERSMFDSSAFGYRYSTGCYAAVWPISSGSVEVEHCLVDPRDRESRVRIVQVLRLREFGLSLQGIKVFVEQWYGPYRNGDQLGGCAIRDSAFASTPALDASRVAGVWQGVGASSSFGSSGNMIQQLGEEYVQKSIREESDIIPLPRQLWCSFRRAQNDETHCEVGWLLDDGQAMTSKCTFSNSAELKEMSIASETVS